MYMMSAIPVYTTQVEIHVLSMHDVHVPAIYIVTAWGGCPKVDVK